MQEMDIMVSKTKKTSKGLDQEGLTQAAECLRTLAHPVRLKMIQLMLSDAKLSVSELAEACEISQPQASDHLRLMQRCGFLRAVRDGRAVYYEVAVPHLQKIMACIEDRFGNANER
jgi:DNA-binding transcriptional ArsR family regulator